MRWTKHRSLSASSHPRPRCGKWRISAGPPRSAVVCRTAEPAGSDPEAKPGPRCACPGKKTNENGIHKYTCRVARRIASLMQHRRLRIASYEGLRVHATESSAGARLVHDAFARALSKPIADADSGGHHHLHCHGADVSTSVVRASSTAGYPLCRGSPHEEFSDVNANADSKQTEASE